jgi:hypothetical protein
VRAAWAGLLVVPTVAVVGYADAASPDRKPPRIVTAVMIDADNDARSDRLRLTYSERVRHAADRDGRYPFAVSGYRLLSVGKASGKALVIVLVEPAQPDQAAVPAVRYGRTRSQPVADRAGNQAQAQVFTRVRAHGHAPPPAQPPAQPPPPATPLDSDRDGTPDGEDCAPRDASIHPGAADLPDLAFVDSNCDGIDGTERDAIFVAPNGNDANPGTKAKPKREIQAAIATVAAGKGRYVLVAFGTYGHVKLASGVGIFGGYDPSNWARRDRFPDGLPIMSGTPEGVLATAAKDVVLQHLRIRGLAGNGDRSAYGIRAIGNSRLTLQRVAVTAGDAAAGLAGASGRTGARGGAGGPANGGNCDGRDGGDFPFGGNGGSSPAGRDGGRGGNGGFEILDENGSEGAPGKIGTLGGPGGARGNPGKPGGRGDSGENGAAGTAGVGATPSTVGAGETWIGQNGGAGGAGEPGNGGGGGGGGGPQKGLFAKDGDGNGGGGGGGGAGGGAGGGGGGSGGGSFGVYLANSKLVVEASTVAAGKGGAGGEGGSGGIGGAGGAGGKGGRVCTSEVGAGGDGGFGGAGGRGGGGGGGAGGPSIGIFKVGSSTATVKSDSKITVAAAGAGGAGGGSGPGGTGQPGAAGIAQPSFP